MSAYDQFRPTPDSEQAHKAGHRFGGHFNSIGLIIEDIISHLSEGKMRTLLSGETMSLEPAKYYLDHFDIQKLAEYPIQLNGYYALKIDCTEDSVSLRILEKTLRGDLEKMSTEEPGDKIRNASKLEKKGIDQAHIVASLAKALRIPRFVEEMEANREVSQFEAGTRRIIKKELDE